MLVIELYFVTFVSESLINCHQSSLSVVTEHDTINDSAVNGQIQTDYILMLMLAEASRLHLSDFKIISVQPEDDSDISMTISS